MEEEADDQPRPSIAQRAARRHSLQRQHPDRYSSLISVLLGQRSGERGRLRDDPAHWHPIARQLVLASLVGVVVVILAIVAHDVWREGRVDTWSGPTDTVTSGQRVLACLPAGTPTHEQLPTWIRYGDRVFALTESRRPLRSQGRPGETGQVETGYSLERLRMLLPVEDPTEGEPTRLLVAIESAPAATLYVWARECTDAP